MVALTCTSNAGTVAGGRGQLAGLWENYISGIRFLSLGWERTLSDPRTRSSFWLTII
jgi:hypothetical protein